MRVLLVTNDFPPKPGGIQQYLASLVDVFQGEVLVLAPRSAGESETRDGVTVHRHRARFLWPLTGVRRWVMREAARFEPDAVLFGAPYPLAWLTRRLRTDLQVPVAVLCHGAEITVSSMIPGVRQLVRRSLRGADVRLAVSHYTLRQVERLTGMPTGYIGSGVDRSRFKPDDLRPTAEASLPVVGCVSRFVPRKGQHRLIRAAAALQRRGTPVQLLFVGSGRRLGALRRLARRLRVQATFEVGVPWEALPGLYRAMDVFCMPCRSRWAGLEVEGLGIVYLEAASSGLPVLAGGSGGAPETIKPGETGFVVRSERDIVESIEMMLGDRNRARAMGTAGRVFMESDYTWSGAADRLEAALAAVK
jgi:phosphatidylinositol alpha-1,6-mannosyltransferase